MEALIIWIFRLTRISYRIYAPSRLRITLHFHNTGSFRRLDNRFNFHWSPRVFGCMIVTLTVQSWADERGLKRLRTDIKDKLGTEENVRQGLNQPIKCKEIPLSLLPARQVASQVTIFQFLDQNTINFKSSKPSWTTFHRFRIPKSMAENTISCQIIKAGKHPQVQINMQTIKFLQTKKRIQSMRISASIANSFSFRTKKLRWWNGNVMPQAGLTWCRGWLIRQDSLDLRQTWTNLETWQPFDLLTKLNNSMKWAIPDRNESRLPTEETRNSTISSPGHDRIHTSTIQTKVNKS